MRAGIILADRSDCLRDARRVIALDPVERKMMNGDGSRDVFNPGASLVVRETIRLGYLEFHGVFALHGYFRQSMFPYPNPGILDT